MDMYEKYNKSIENNSPQQVFYIPISIEVIGNVSKAEVERLVFKAIEDQYNKGFNFKDKNATAIGLNIMAPNSAKKVFL